MTQMASRKRSLRTIAGAGKGFLLGLLILLYGAGSLRIESLHRFLHEHESGLHTQEQENNACHRTVFHGSSSSCEHPTHLSPNWKCPLCDLRFDSHVVAVEDKEAIKPEQAVVTGTRETQKPIAAPNRLATTRGPPTC